MEEIKVDEKGFYASTPDVATVRAKCRVNSITLHTHGQTDVRMTPVYSQDPNHENKKFWDATPSGEIALNITKPEAAQAFEVGVEYYVDFTKAE